MSGLAITHTGALRIGAWSRDHSSGERGRAGSVGGHGSTGHLDLRVEFGHRHRMDEEQGIYRGEVRAIMIALADLTVEVRTILRYIEGDDDEEETQDIPDS